VSIVDVPRAACEMCAPPSRTASSSFACFAARSIHCRESEKRRERSECRRMRMKQRWRETTSYPTHTTVPQPNQRCRRPLVTLGPKVSRAHAFEDTWAQGRRRFFFTLNKKYVRSVLAFSFSDVNGRVNICGAVNLLSRKCYACLLLVVLCFFHRLPASFSHTDLYC
jgi:hypothetical protein